MFAVASAFLMHTGARHITFDLTNAQKQLLSQPLSKLIILAAMFYISTRSLIWSTTLLVIYYVTINMFLNENHSLNVFSPSWLVANGYVEQHSYDPEYTEMYKKNLEMLSSH